MTAIIDLPESLFHTEAITKGFGTVHDELVQGDELYKLVTATDQGVTIDLGKFDLAAQQLSRGGHGYFNCLDSIQDRLGARNRDVTFIIGITEDGRTEINIRARDIDSSKTVVSA